jgi:hypothetical protein
MSKLSELLLSLYTVRQQKSALEKTEKAILTEIKPLVDPEFDKLPEEPIVYDGIALTRTEGTRRSISGDKLLERGVAPDIVAYSTEVSTFYTYRTKEQKPT